MSGRPRCGGKSRHEIGDHQPFNGDEWVTNPEALVPDEDMRHYCDGVVVTVPARR